MSRDDVRKALSRPPTPDVSEVSRFSIIEGNKTTPESVALLNQFSVCVVYASTRSPFPTCEAVRLPAPLPSGQITHGSLLLVLVP